MLTHNQLVARIQLMVVIAVLLLMGLFAHWYHQDTVTKPSYVEAVRQSTIQHSYSTQKQIDDASAQCIGR